MQNGRIIRNTFYVQLASYVGVALTSSLGSLIDGIIIGQYLGVNSIAAFGIVNPLMVILALIGAVLAYGARSRFVRLIGSGKTKEAQNVFSLACALAAGIATAVVIIVLVFSVPITRMLGATGNAAALLPKARAYMIGVAIGIPARNVMWVLWAFVPIDNNRGLPVIASAVMTVTNILLDLAVVFVFHGDTFEMGLVTSISYIAALLVFMTHFFRHNTFLKLSFKNISVKDTGELLAEGVPSGMHRLGHTIKGIFMNRLLAAIASSAAIAAYSVHGQAEALLIPLAAGIADTVSALAGVLTGEEDRPMMKHLLITSVRATFIFTLGVSVISWVFAPQFAALFISGDSETLKMSIRAVRAYSIGMPLHGLNLIYQEYMHGIGRTRLSAVSGFLTECGFMILSAGIMIGLLGADAVWYAFPVTQVLLVIYFIAVTFLENRRLNIRPEGFWQKVLLLPDSFDVTEKDCMDRSITTMTEVAKLSQEVWSFCEAYGCDDRRKYLMSLAVEEMAGNVIEHGFSKDKRNHSIDVRIIHKGEDYIIRIRDDCLIFDPVGQLKLYSDDDPAHHIGLRMIIRTAKNVRYTSFLRLNNLFIKI